MQVMNFTFIHDGKQWIVWDEEIKASGRDLAELDSNLRSELGSLYEFQPGTRLEVKMDFDYSTIPEWMKEYQPYYIHRNVEFTF